MIAAVQSEERQALSARLSETRHALVNVKAALLTAEKSLSKVGDMSAFADLRGAASAVQAVLEPALHANVAATEVLCSLEVLTALKRAGRE